MISTWAAAGVAVQISGGRGRAVAMEWRKDNEIVSFDCNYEKVAGIKRIEP
jgi:hypothetical protein